MSTAPDHDARPRSRRALALVGVLMAVAAIVLLVAGGGEDEPDRAPAGQAGSRFGEARTTPARDGTSGASSTALERSVAGIMAAGFPGEEQPERAYGALLVTDANFRSAGQLRRVTRRFARSAARERRRPPLILADPALLGDLGPAEPATIGAEGEPADARETARRAGGRVRRAGVNLVLAPTADLGVGGTPSELRTFGDEPLVVARYVGASVRGWLETGVLPVPGRFPGEGAASQDPIEGPAIVGLSVEELVARDLRPFAAAVTAKVPAIQMSAAMYAAWDGVTPATLLPDAVALARERLGFQGAIVSADLVAATAATGESIGKAAVEALAAGCDLLLIPGGAQEQQEAYDALVKAVREGRIRPERVREAQRRVAELRTRLQAARR